MMSKYLSLAPPPGPTAAVGGGPHGSGGPTPTGPTAAAMHVCMAMQSIGQTV